MVEHSAQTLLRALIARNLGGRDTQQRERFATPFPSRRCCSTSGALGGGLGAGLTDDSSLLVATPLLGMCTVAIFASIRVWGVITLAVPVLVIGGGYVRVAGRRILGIKPRHTLKIVPAMLLVPFALALLRAVLG